MYFSDNPYTDLNFFNEACGTCEIVSSTEGVIKSPNYPERNRNNSYCEYTITAPPGKRIELKFTDFNVNPFLPLCNYVSVSEFSSILLMF